MVLVHEKISIDVNCHGVCWRTGSNSEHKPFSIRYHNKIYKYLCVFITIGQVINTIDYQFECAVFINAFYVISYAI
jgi:hypothetical protein